MPRLFPSGFPIRLDGIDVLVHPAARRYYLNNFEPLCRKAFREALHDGARVLDVGSNAGVYARIAAEAVGRSGAVFAVEPSPVNLPILHRNVARCENVTVIPVAASDRNTSFTFFLSEDTLNDAISEGPYKATVGTTRVDARPLDDVIEPPIDLIKMDVQGHEPEALKGLARTIQQSPGVKILIEWSPACLVASKHPPDAVPRLLSEFGFNVVQVIPHEELGYTTIEAAYQFLRDNPQTTAYWNVVAAKAA